MVPAMRRGEDEIARLGVDDLVVKHPVDLALGHIPAFIFDMVVPVVDGAGRLADRRDGELLADHDAHRPVRRPLLPLDLLKGYAE